MQGVLSGIRQIRDVRVKSARKLDIGQG